MINASIVLYKTSTEDLTQVFESIVNSDINKIYIVDNSPTNELKDFANNLSGKINYIHGHGNIGYGAGHNIAIKESIRTNAEYHVVLNPDIYFDKDVISELAAYMDANTDVGQVMPKVFYPTGELQYLCKLLPKPSDLFARRFAPQSLSKKSQHRFELRFTDYNNDIINVPFLSGCFMFLRCSALEKVGMFDERFFMYGEDIDLCRRIHAKYKTIYYPKVSIIHAHEAASYKDIKMLWVHIQNIGRYFNKWGWLSDKERKTINGKVLEDLNYTK